MLGVVARALARGGCRELCPLLGGGGIGSQRALCASAGDNQEGGIAPVDGGTAPQKGAEQDAVEGEGAGGAEPGDDQPGDGQPGDSQPGNEPPVFGYYEAAHVPGS